MIKVTKGQLLQIMPTAASRIDKYLSYINGYAEVFGIDTPLRMAHYLAQIAHESGELRWTVEQGTRSYFDKYDTGKLARQLGNTPQKDGDGYKYRGRGLIQITGRSNYDAYNRSAYCKGDVIENPELLEKPLGAVKSSMWWWKTHGLNILADNDDVVKITKRINGGQNGLKERCGYLARAKRALGISK
uniref:Chitinase A n=1 Tax=Siphoviridae sp. ctA4S13 TaxID=2826179 RepID=A0A8S5MQV0_9CAUD|nr:MAG TPA: Chitinase A [Siphoviridae sp. ctA4S13]DAG37736.1 MAG TPA: Chitinase A [Caudoviricetes sp.]